MSDYPFDLLAEENAERVKKALQNRPLKKEGFEKDASRFYLDNKLKDAINVSLAVGEPLLLTGEPGTGKTQTAYHVAWKFELGEVLHFQVKSDSVAQDLLYEFDSVRYFHDAHLKGEKALNKADYIEKKALWTALESDTPRVLLIDEIDKAPRDFPNDLLLEFDQMRFTVKETGENIRVNGNNRPLVFITSNSERRLPEAFLRRCVFHHIHFDRDLLRLILNKHESEFANLSNEFVELAIDRFLQIRNENIRKLPATGELLVWLRSMALSVGSSERELRLLFERLEDYREVPPYLGALLKDRQDVEKIQQQYEGA